MTRVIVIGAGLAGLAAAAVLAREADTTVVERLPAIGGLAGWEDPLARRLDTQGRDTGVRQVLGATALRWTAGELLVAAPGSIHRLTADHLVFAGGTRPATPVELRLTGDRSAGIVSATVAEHLLGARVRLGRLPLVYGVSHWADLVARRLHAQGLRVRVLGQPGAVRPAWADEWLGSGVPRIALGQPRISHLEISAEPGGPLETVTCDALILAAPARPVRNVEGAVFAGDHVTFIQETDLAAGPTDVVARAEAAARALTQQIGRIVA
jgi:D-hydroxyproline dehydrogenase subunit alpha